MEKEAKCRQNVNKQLTKCKQTADMEKEAKIIIPFHPKVSQEQIKEAKKHCQAFKTILKAEGRSIEAVEVTWSLNDGGLLGSLPPYGILVTRNNQPRASLPDQHSELLRGKKCNFGAIHCLPLDHPVLG